MTATYRIRTKAGHLDATESDRWQQPDGRAIPTRLLQSGDFIPGMGRVIGVAVVRVVEEAA